MNVPFVDLRSQYREIRPGAQRGLAALFQRGDFILGQDVQDFEISFARYLGVPFALGVNSGTDALFLGLLGLGIGPGDEVVVPAFTYIASAFAVTYTGAQPVFVDINEQTFTIDADLIERAVTPKTKAIMPVHLYGQAADMDPIARIAKRHRLKVIEDAAQAHGTQYKGKNTGGLGDVAAFSFYPTKNLSGFGDAGMLVTRDSQLFRRLLRLRDYGRRTRYEHVCLGYNSRLDSVQAVFLKEKLKRLDVWNKKRRAVARAYADFLKGVEGVRLPAAAGYGQHVYHIFAVRVKDRDRVFEGLKNFGIQAAVHYPIPLHLQEVYKDLGYRKGDFPVAERVAQEVLCLPIYPHIRPSQVSWVVRVLKRLARE